MAAARRLRPDLVLLDVLLPDMSGFAVAEALAAEVEPPSGRAGLEQGAVRDRARPRGVSGSGLRHQERAERRSVRRPYGRSVVRAVRLVVWVAGAALCAVMLTGAIRSGGDVIAGYFDGDAFSPYTRNVFLIPPGQAIAYYAGALVSLTLGVIVWERRPESRTGILLIAFPSPACSGIRSCSRARGWR